MTELEKLQAENESYKQDIENLRSLFISTLDALGLLENGKMVAKDEIMPNLLKAGGQIMSDATLSDMPMIGKPAKERLEKRFGFFKNLDPILKKYV